MTTLDPLVCKSCNGTGKWDVGTEDEGECRADYCVEGTLMCSWCTDNSGADEPAVGEHWVGEADTVIPGCRMHLQRAKDFDAREDRGDNERDMRKDGGI